MTGRKKENKKSVPGIVSARPEMEDSQKKFKNIILTFLAKPGWERSKKRKTISFWELFLLDLG